MKTLENKLINSVLNGNEKQTIIYYKKLINTYENNLIRCCNRIRSLKNYLLSMNSILYTSCDKNRISYKDIFEKRNAFMFEIERKNNLEDVYNLGKEIILFYAGINQNKYSYTSNQIVNQALNYIHNNLDKNLNLEKVAKEIHISKSHLCNLFPIYLKSSFSNYVNKTKIEHGKSLLEQSSKSLVDVAFECGFNSQSYFCSTFKKIEGITPLQYKKNCL